MELSEKTLRQNWDLNGKDDMAKQLKICRFTEPELEVFRRLCNFTNTEMQYFNLRAKDKSNIEIAMQMNISESTVYSIAREVKRKMIKIL